MGSGTKWQFHADATIVDKLCMDIIRMFGDNNLDLNDTLLALVCVLSSLLESTLPGDVARQRRLVERVVYELNKNIGFYKGHRNAAEH